MALDAILDNCTRASDGTLTVYINIVDDTTGAVIKKITASGADAAEIETELRPRMQSVKAEYDSHQLLKNAAQQRLDALKIELGFGG